MFRHELSAFLQRVLDQVERAGGIQIDRYGDPDRTFVHRVASRLRADPDQIRMALEGLRAGHCLVEEVLEVPGAEPVVWWRVHPQCLVPTRPPTLAAER